jgi:Flp pilus assembly protein TadD
VRFAALIVAAALAPACRRAPEPPPAAYAPAAACQGCHAAIAASYRQTGMGRSFARFDAAAGHPGFRPGAKFYHQASDRYYTMTLRGGAAYLRRHQKGPNGGEINVLEKRVDFIMGSGNKGQTFLHRNARNELIELPVAWYTSNGGYWAMNPNYDRPDHDDFRRRIAYDCFFCHNGYPQGLSDDSIYADPVYPASLPQGIDCQRCHGPGAAHVQLAAHKAPAGEVKRAIVNPRRLRRDAQMEICLQCHLQSTSYPLPHAIVRLGRGVFSHRAGEPLTNYMLFFDHPADAGYGDKFEIAHAAYRLRQSACYKNSALTCITCHNPHSAAPAGSAACRSCHARAAGPAHAGVKECLTCHMPQRRTSDAVHIVMTDHRIVRRAPANLTAPLAERHGQAYRGPVAPYYPSNPDALHLALAQVRTGTNLSAGVAMLEQAVRDTPSCGGDCYFELAEALGKAGRVADAPRAGEEALRRSPASVHIQRAHGAQLSAAGELARGAQLLEKALAQSAEHPRLLHDLAMNYSRQGRLQDAIALLRRAAAADPDSPEIHSALGAALHSGGDAAGAEAAFREAIRAQPDSGNAHANLATLLLARNHLDEAEYHLRLAVRFSPSNIVARQSYGVLLAQKRRLPEAISQIEAALRFEPANDELHLVLGTILADSGNLALARTHLARAAASARPEVRQAAAATIEMLKR